MTTETFVQAPRRRGSLAALVGFVVGEVTGGVAAGYVSYQLAGRPQGLDGLIAIFYGLIGAYVGAVIGCGLALAIMGYERPVRSAALTAVLTLVGVGLTAISFGWLVPAALIAPPLVARRIVTGGRHA